MSYNRLGVLGWYVATNSTIVVWAANSVHRLQYDTESCKLAQCRRHGVLNVITSQLHHPAGAKDQPALPYDWACRRDMLLASSSSEVKYLGKGADHRSWVSSFLWVPSQNSATMRSRQTICIQIRLVLSPALFCCLEGLQRFCGVSTSFDF